MAYWAYGFLLSSVEYLGIYHRLSIMVFLFYLLGILVFLAYH